MKHAQPRNPAVPARSEMAAAREATSPGLALRRLTLARGVTYFGGSAAFWALSAVLYQKTHSPTLVAAAALASFSVPAALSPVAGLLGDNFDRQKVIVASELGGALCFVGLALAGSPATLLGLRVLASVAAAPLVPATAAALPSLAPAEELDRANAVLSRAGTAGALIGAAVAGFILATVGGPWVFLLNTVTFLISAGLVWSIKGNFRPQLSQRGRLGAGVVFIFRHDLLRPVAAAYGLAFIGIGVSIPAEIVLATDFGAGTLGYAGLFCLWGIGALIGAGAGGRLARRPLQMIVIGSAALALGAGFWSISLAPIFAIALLGMTIAGAGFGLWEVAQTSLIQRAAPDGIRSRVLAAGEAGMQSGIAIGLLVSGLVVGVAGAAGAFGVAGAASLAAALILFLRGLEAEAEVATPQPNCSRPAGLRAIAQEREPVGVPTSNEGSRPVPALQISRPELMPTP